ncbi:hypothetical protein [Streptomyces pacificus]|uniref:Uncharacterized protein n=1 Tax=Streptomyces pacificus TaxID=2705029 RepID=A0A6A0AVD9_9ACTN|nr:hypothetical protein [Streptomyces pacificus]GFH35894.1 hypothetical protein SCWH03_21160 [Streptomyces pacificus]
MSDAADRLPDPDSLSELLDAERTRALRGIMPPWIYFLLSIVCAAGVWLPHEGTARAVAVACACVPGLHIVLRIRALTEALTLYGTEDDADDADSRKVEATAQRWVERMIAITIVVASIVLAAITLLVPLAWLRTALPLLCLWFVLDLYRARSERVHARQVIALAAEQDWYPAYTRHIEERRATLR